MTWEPRTRGEKVGANLEELYKGGKTELPPIADSFAGAASTLAGLSTSRLFEHDSALGLGGSGPSSAFDSLCDAIVSSARKSGEVMQDVADAVVTTAQNLARTDDEYRRAFILAGGDLDG